VIAGAVRDDAAFGIGIAELHHRIAGPAKFESPDALKLFAFEKQIASSHFADGRAGHDRRAMGIRFDAGSGSANVVKGGGVGIHLRSMIRIRAAVVESIGQQRRQIAGSEAAVSVNIGPQVGSKPVEMSGECRGIECPHALRE